MCASCCRGMRQIADKLAIVRSLSHGHAVHDDASHWVQTGYPLLMARERGQAASVPGSGRLAAAWGEPAGACRRTCACPKITARTWAFIRRRRTWASRYNALSSGGDPSLGNYRAPTFGLPAAVTLPRLDDRQNLLRSLDRLGAAAEHVAGFADLDAAQQQALRTGRRLAGSGCVRPGARARRSCASATAGTLMAKRPCWPGDWSKPA